MKSPFLEFTVNKTIRSFNVNFIMKVVEHTPTTTTIMFGKDDVIVVVEEYKSVMKKINDYYSNMNSLI